LNIYNIQLGLATQQTNSAAADVLSKQAAVDDLTRLLALAQKQLELSKNNSAQLSSQKAQLLLTISSASSNLTSIGQSLNSCNIQSATLQLGIKNLQTNLTSQQTVLAQYNNQNYANSNQLSSLQSVIVQETANYNNIINQTDSARSSLVVLQNALPSAV
jgi:chromosome segregation ATPase